MSATRGRRTPEELWKAIEEQSALDDMEDVAALTPEELDAELAAGGTEPEAVRAEGAALAARLLAMRERETKAQDDLSRARALLAGRRARRPRLSRKDLLDRIDRATKDPRLPERAMVQFRNRGFEQATDEELEALLDELEALPELHGDEPEKGE